MVTLLTELISGIRQIGNVNDASVQQVGDENCNYFSNR
jgi:hypothetical protein